MWREFTLIKRTFVVYKAKTLQVVIVALVAATLFLRTHIHPISPNDGQEIAGFCFFATLVMLFNGIAELSMSVSQPVPLTCPCCDYSGAPLRGVVQALGILPGRALPAWQQTCCLMTKSVACLAV